MASLLDFIQSLSNSAASNVSAPVDGINWLLGKTGLPVSDTPYGGSAWMEKKGFTKPVKQSAASLAGETVGMVSPMLAVAKAPQIAKGLLQAGENAMAPGASIGTLGGQRGAILPSEYNLPVNKDGTVTLLHGTSKDAAKQIIATGRLKSAGEPDVYLTTSPTAGYGDGTVVKVNVDPKRLFIDDEFPDGRFDFRLPATNGQAAISRPTLLGDEAQALSKTEQVPVSDEFFSATGVPKAKMFADVERLRRKHPADFPTTQDLRNHLSNAYGSEPNFVSAASDPRYTLTTTPEASAEALYNAAISDLRGVNGGNYQVISAFPMSEKQLLKKKSSAKK